MLIGIFNSQYEQKIYNYREIASDGEENLCHLQAFLRLEIQAELIC